MEIWIYFYTLVSYGCSATSAVTANGTYFSSDSVGSSFRGQCQIKYCPEDSVCQLRLDFQTMMIYGPYSDPLAGEKTNKSLGLHCCAYERLFLFCFIRVCLFLIYKLICRPQV